MTQDMLFTLSTALFFTIGLILITIAIFKQHQTLKRDSLSAKACSNWWFLIVNILAIMAAANAQDIALTWLTSIAVLACGLSALTYHLVKQLLTNRVTEDALGIISSFLDVIFLVATIDVLAVATMSLARGAIPFYLKVLS